MKSGDEVLVYPLGDREKAARARVAVYSSNGRAIAVGFPDPPPFRWDDPLSFAIHPEHGLMLFASRTAFAGSWGPWVEMMGGNHYEIEEPLA